MGTQHPKSTQRTATSCMDLPEREIKLSASHHLPNIIYKSLRSTSHHTSRKSSHAGILKHKKEPESQTLNCEMSEKIRLSLEWK